jgi:hypothetical protein
MLVKVWNDGDFTWKEKFKNQEIVIEPHGYIMMDRDEAVDFEGKFFIPKLDANRQILPESQKRIRVEGAYGPHLYEKGVSKQFVCQADGREFPTKQALDDYVKANWKHAQTETTTEPENDAPRKRGRPPKHVSEGI